MSQPDFIFSEAAKWFNQKQYPQAIEWFNKAEQSGNHSAQLYFYRGAAHYNLKDNHSAITDLEKALELSPENAETANLLGNAYFNYNNFEAAIEKYSQALYYNPQHYSSLHWRLLARLQLKNNVGKIINREAAQHDADMLLPVAGRFFELTSEEGKPLEIVQMEIEEDGGLIIKVK